MVLSSVYLYMLLVLSELFLGIFTHEVAALRRDLYEEVLGKQESSVVMETCKDVKHSSISTYMSALNSSMT